ncbi:hypothetical protein CVV68_13480 [Arthrobacter livingstonensis]|uniref:Uncharacterized protein n=1 Tax=Arthrobacter livingstonensis TaxID=670078 RepID=A0A2V5LWH6_9MICC|nr:hypothetical protein [Arthrobacter livingstonensis]PYI66576.1 hypothetical protein CVV68_13480 [Arthrobacter livingstonensis]
MRAANPQGQTATSRTHGDDGNELAARIALLTALRLGRPTTPGVLAPGELIGTQKVLDLLGIRVTYL